MLWYPEATQLSRSHYWFFAFVWFQRVILFYAFLARQSYCLDCFFCLSCGTYANIISSNYIILAGLPHKTLYARLPASPSLACQLMCKGCGGWDMVGLTTPNRAHWSQWNHVSSVLSGMHPSLLAFFARIGINHLPCSSYNWVVSLITSLVSIMWLNFKTLHTNLNLLIRWSF